MKLLFLFCCHIKERFLSRSYNTMKSETLFKSYRGKLWTRGWWNRFLSKMAPFFWSVFEFFFFLLISLHGLIKIIFLINWYTLEIFHVWIVYCKLKILAEVWLTFAKEYNKIQPNLGRYYISTVKWGSSIPLCKCMLYHYVD